MKRKKRQYSIKERKKERKKGLMLKNLKGRKKKIKIILKKKWEYKNE